MKGWHEGMVSNFGLTPSNFAFAKHLSSKCLGLRH